jgi:hypothetical protein
MKALKAWRMKLFTDDELSWMWLALAELLLQYVPKGNISRPGFVDEARALEDKA